MSVRIGFMASLGFSQMEPAQVCSALKELGYDSVEWTLAHCDPRQKSVDELRELVRITTDHGLVPSEVVIQQDYVTSDTALHEERVALTEQCIHTFREAGIDCINLFTGPAPWDDAAPVVGRDISEGDAWDLVFRAFDRIVPTAEAAGMELAVENVWGMVAHDYYTCRFLIEHYDRQCLGVNFDPSHDILAGHFDVRWLIRQWGDRIKHCHIKDAVGVPAMGKFVFPLIGEGRVDWQGYFGALADIGFDGTCSVEFESFDYLKNVLKDDMVEAARISMASIAAVRG